MECEQCKVLMQDLELMTKLAVSRLKRIHKLQDKVKEVLSWGNKPLKEK